LTDLRARGAQELGQRRNAIVSNKCVGLDPKREERDEINHPKKTQEPTAGVKVSRPPNLFAPQ
jgi:hypothetical protein